jgi:hypothetical protein
MLNPFFLNGSKGEQNLLQDLINESIRMHGVEVYYLPQKFIGENTIIKEVVASVFEDALPLEAYVVSYDGWEGQGDTLSKFGIETKDELVLSISQERYETYIQPLLTGKEKLKLISRPKEGDLIYFPLGDRLFEIKHVKRDDPFYQLQKNYVYELRCELFRYEDEVIDTQIKQINDEVEDLGYIATFSLIGAGSTATGTVAITTSTGSVKTIDLLARGSDYRIPPTIKLSPPQVSGGTTATAVAITSTRNSINYYYIDRILITNPGSGYLLAPSISIISDIGTGAIATVGISTIGSISSVSIGNSGGPYINPPIVSFSPNPYSQYDDPIAESILNENGNVVGVMFKNTGEGYPSIPTITFSPPETIGLLVDNGFVLNETVTGQTSSSTARVKTWNSVTKVLEVSHISGEFVEGEKIVGSNGSIFVIDNIVLFDQVNTFADNDIIEQEADAILDFSEKNPFGEV